MRELPWRRSLVLTCVLTLLMAALVAGLRTAPSQASACDLKPLADISVDQVASGFPSNTSPTAVVYTVTITNLGPCNVTGLTFTDTLPTPALGVVTGFNPGSWSCPTPLTPLASITCTLNANLGVPGTAQISIQTNGVPGVPTGNITNMAHADVTEFGGGPVCCDSNTTNNTSFGGFATSGGTITGLAGSNTTDDLQQSGVTILGSFGSASIRHGVLGAACPTAVPSCFGRLVSLAVTTDAVFQVSFFFDALLFTSGGRPGVAHFFDSAWVDLSFCKDHRNPPPPGCIVSVSKGTSTDFVSSANPKGVFFVVVVATLFNGDWTGD